MNPRIKNKKLHIFISISVLVSLIVHIVISSTLNIPPYYAGKALGKTLFSPLLTSVIVAGIIKLITIAIGKKLSFKSLYGYSYGVLILIQTFLFLFIAIDSART